MKNNWKEFLDEILAIAARHNLKNHKAFIFWFIKATENLSDSDILEAITDGSGDAGCDAVIINSDAAFIFKTKIPFPGFGKTLI